mgnify:CR=1 FL=1
MARNSIILNGKSSDTITGLIIQELPPISKPLMRSQVEEIDGRDGDIVTKLGFSAYDKEISVGLYGNFDINEIIAYFNSEGTVTFSNEPDKFYYYQILEQIDFERLVRFRTATINFHVQPFKYSTTEEAETIEAETVSGEGNNIVLENTSDAPFSKLTPKGDTFQQTYSGANLWQPQNHAQSQGITCTANADGSMTIAGTATGSYALLSDTIAISLPAGTYTLSINKTLPFRVLIKLTYADDTQHDVTVAIGETSGKINVAQAIKGMRLYTGGTTSGQVLNETIFLQFETGDQPTAWQPFVGRIPSPSPDYPQQIDTVTGEQTVSVVGKNLLNPVGLDTKVFSGTINNTYYYNADLNCTIEAGKTYTLSVQVDAVSVTPYQFLVLLGDTIPRGGIATVSNLTTIGGRVQATFTPTQANIDSYGNRLFMRVPRYGTPTTATYSLSNIQLEYGDSMTSYQPYQSQSYTIDLGSIELCKIGTYQDYIWKDGSDWKVHKAIGTQTFDGAETWTKFVTSGKTSYYTNVADGTGLQVVSDYFSNRYSSSFPELGGVSYNGNSNKNMLFRMMDDTTISDASAFKTWLSTHNTTVYYALATPTDTEITDANLIAQLDALLDAELYNGQNNIAVMSSAQPAGSLDMSYVMFDATNRHKVYIWSNSDNTWQIIVQ